MLIASCTTATKQTNLNISKRGLAQDRTPLNDRQLNEAFNAAIRGKVDVLSRFHNEGYELNIRDRWGASLAFVAARHEKINVLEFLDSIGHDLNAPNNMGDTPANYAKRHEKINVLEFLRSKGHDVSVPNKKEQLSNLEMKKSGEKKSDRTSNSEEPRVERTREAARKELLERFGISDPNATDAKGRPIAFDYHSPEDLKLFFDAGLDANIKGPGDVRQVSSRIYLEVTLLQHYADSYFDSSKKMELILQAGANPLRASFGSANRHHYFVTNIESIQLLLLAGVRLGNLGVESYDSAANYIWRRNLGYAADVLSALNEAAGRGGENSVDQYSIYKIRRSTIDRVNSEVVERVIRETENTLDLTDRQKETRRFLHKLAIQGNDRELRTLLRRRSVRRMIDVDNGRGSTPLLSAVKAGNYKNAMAFLSHGADPNAKDSVGNTALHYVTILYRQRKPEASREIARALHAVGADSSIKNNYGHTPLDEMNIRGTGDKEVTKILRKRKRSRMRCF